MKIVENVNRLGTEAAFKVFAEAKKLEKEGKELPMPNSQKVFRGKSPIVQYLLGRYPTYQTVRQAVVHDKMNGDFSSPETLNKELVTQ